jgi:hypothetical protein
MECGAALLDSVPMTLSSKSTSGTFHTFAFECQVNIFCECVAVNLINPIFSTNTFFSHSSGNLKTSTGYVGLPSHIGRGSRLINGNHCYVEVTLGCCQNRNDNTSQANSTFAVNLPHNQCPEPSVGSKDHRKGQSDLSSVCEKKFIYPAEAVLVPILQSAFAKFSLKR